MTTKKRYKVELIVDVEYNNYEKSLKCIKDSVLENIKAADTESHSKFKYVRFVTTKEKKEKRLSAYQRGKAALRRLRERN